MVQCEAKHIDLNSVGFHMPCNAIAAAAKRPDNDADDDSDDSEASDNDSSDDDTEFPLINLAELQKSIAGDTRQAPIDAYSPVSDIREMSLLMELVGPFVVRGRAGSYSIRYEDLACAYNAELQRRFALDKTIFQHSGLRMKSAAHVREFFERTDRGLEIGEAIAPVRDRFIALRTLLRDCTSGPVPPAMHANSELPDCISSSGLAGSGCCSNSGVDSGTSKRKARSCKTCDSQGRGNYWKLRQIGTKRTMRFVCTNTVCELYEYDDHSSFSKAPKSKSKRCCISCRAAGLGDFELRQIGFRANTQFLCTNPFCVLVGDSSAHNRSTAFATEVDGSGRVPMT